MRRGPAPCGCCVSVADGGRRVTVLEGSFGAEARGPANVGRGRRHRSGVGMSSKRKLASVSFADEEELFAACGLLPGSTGASSHRMKRRSARDPLRSRMGGYAAETGRGHLPAFRAGTFSRTRSTMFAGSRRYWRIVRHETLIDESGGGSFSTASRGRQFAPSRGATALHFVGGTPSRDRAHPARDARWQRDRITDRRRGLLVRCPRPS